MVLRGFYKKETFYVNAFYLWPFVESLNLNELQYIIMGLLSSKRVMPFTDVANFLKLTKEQLILQLENLIYRGVIICYIKKNNIVTDWIWRPLEEIKISNQDICIIGTAMMLRKANIENIAKLLKYPKEEVIQKISKLLLFRKIEAEFIIKTNFFAKDTISIIVKKFIIQPEKKDLSLLPANEKEVVGFLLLTKKAKLKTISRFIEKPIHETVSLLASLTARGTFQFIFTSEDTVRPVLVPDMKPTRTIEEMSSLSFFNYEALLGMLTTRKKIKVKKLSFWMNREEDEIIEALINLYLEGFISCTLVRKVIYIDGIFQYSRTQEGSLERWEKIILGMVIAKTVISVKDIKKSFGTENLIAREKLYSFYGKGLIKGEIINYRVNSKLIPEEIPIFPPLNQIEDFPIHYQEIFGYIVSNITVKVPIMAKLWNKSKNAIKNIIYELTGAGLINVIQNRNTFILQSAQKYYPTQEINSLGHEYVQIINEIEKSKRRRVKIENIQKRVNIPHNDIFKIICQLLAHGYYKGTISEKVFIKKGKLILPAGKLKCYYCGHTIEDSHLPCPNCSKSQPLCIICNGLIKKGQDLLECPNCENVGHKEHMLKWISIKEECPICKTQISKRNLVEKTA
ncbi:MAG: hypothetical protein ACTSVB_05285 [Candidatus Heimdallarchaeaceae archaeon]